MLLNHFYIVLHQTIVDWQTAEIVLSIRSRHDFLNKVMFSVQADNMLNSLALEVLLATCTVKLFIAGEPVETNLITISRASKNGVFTQSILDV